MNRKERRKAEKLRGKGAAGKSGGGARPSTAASAAPSAPPAASPGELRAMAQAHLKAGRPQAALAALEAMFTVQGPGVPVDGAARAMAGKLAFDAGEPKRAEAHLTLAAEASGGRPDLWLMVAECRRAQGDLAGALTPHLRAVDAAPQDPELLMSLIKAHWAAGETTDLPPLCDRYSALRPLSTQAVAHKALAQYRAGDRAGGDATLGLDALVDVRDIAAPEGWESLAAFNSALAAHVCGHPTMAVPDPDHPTYHNPKLHITDELLGDDSGPIADLRKIVEDTIAGYRAARADLDHPFIRNWPEVAALSAWATLLQGEGTVDPHIHLEGYLATVYYPELPAEAGAGDAETGGPGWLELGRPSSEFPDDIDATIRYVQPKEGRLIVFPGFLFHRTTPFQSTGRRISIAVDIVVPS